MKFVRIESKINITVTAGLDHQDLTKVDSDIHDRLKVSAEWPKTTLDIKQGTGIYPSFITSWPTVKALEKNNVLTIGAEMSDGGDEQKAEELEKAIEEVKEITTKRRRKNTSLNEISSDDN